MERSEQKTQTRWDVRLVHFNDPLAVLRADGPGQLPLWGWTDSDADAFLSALRDQVRHDTGKDPREVVIYSASDATTALRWKRTRAGGRRL